MNINTGSRRLITALGIALLSLLSVAAKEHTVVFTAAQGDPDGKVTICEETNNLNSAETFTKTNEYVKLEVAAKKGTAVYSDQIVLPYGSNTSHSKITISRLKEGASITGIRLVMRDGDEGNLEVTNSESAKVGITPQGDIWKVNGIDWRDFSVDDVDPQKIVISVINRSVIIREIEVTYDDGIPVPTYKVNVGDAPNATVTVNDKAPENVEIEEGQEANIQVKADEGYVITSVSVNGDKYLYDGQQQVSFTRKMTDNLNITVETEAISMGTITIAPAEHTTISVSYDGQAVETGSSLAIGSQIIVSVRAEDGYRLTEAKIGETPMTISDNGSSAMATHTLSGDIIISCKVEECTYAVTVECPESASVMIDDKLPAEMGVAKLGDKLRIFVKAKTGFFISSVAINGQTSTFSNQSEASFEHTVTGPVKITVTTAAMPQGGLTWTADDGATVTVTHKGTAVEQGAKLANGETIVVTVRAKEDYRLKSFSVNGTDKLTQLNAGNGTMTLTVNGDMQIQAGSEKYRFAATVNADPAQIEVWADGQQLTTGRKFDKDDKVEITVKAKTGYSLNKATIGGGALNITEDGSLAKMTHTVSGDFTIAAEAVERTYAVTVECPESASVMIDDKLPAEMGVAKLGDKLRILVKAQTGFFISSVSISGQSSTFSNQSEASFEHTVTGPVTITVTTTAIPQGGITWTADDGATVTVTHKGSAIEQGAKLANGETIVVTVRAKEDYRLTSFSVNNDHKLTQLNDGNGTMTLTVDGDMQIQAGSEKYRFAATVNADPAQIEVWADGQQLTSGRKFDKDTKAEITVKAKTGYSLNKATIGGVALNITEEGSQAKVTHTVSGDFTIAAEAVERTYAVTVECPESASVTIDGKLPAEMGVAKLGDKLRIFVKAKTGFFISSVAISGQTSTFSNQSEATFEHTVTGPVKIIVTTAAIPQGGITWTVGSGATVSVKHNGTAIEPGTTLPKGSTIVIEAGAEEDYQLSEVMIGESDRLADMLRTGSVTVTVEGELSISVRARKIRATATLTFDPAQVEINLANGDKVETNKEIEIKITAKDGFRLVSATAGDQIIPLAEDRLSATGKITVTDNFTLTVKSEPIPTYKVEWTEAENCKIEVSGAENGSSVREGKSIHIKVTPAEGFKLTAVTVNGTPRTIADDQLFDTDIIVTADIMIAAEASALPLPVFAITCTQPEHGRIEVKGADDQAAITQGTAVTIAVTADEGYEIQQVAIDDVAQQGDGASTMEIPVTVTGAHTVSAVIVPRQYPVVWESAEGATVSVKSGGKTFKSGDKAGFGSKLAITVTSDANHRLGVVKINGEIADLTNSNSFTQELNVEGPCTIQVWTTVSDKYPVVWSAGDNGSVEVKLADGTDIENGARVVDGAQIEVTIKPYDACKIRSVNVNNVAQQITDETKPLVIKLTVDKPIVISALFYRDTYHLTVKTDDPLNGEVNVEILRDEASPQSDYAGDVKGGKRVRLTAVTYPGCSFGGWTQNGASIAGSAVMTTTIEEASSFVARFRLNTYRQHSVKFLSTDEAHGSIRLLQLDGIALDMAIRSEHIFTTTRRLMVEATPTHPDAIFEGWTDEKGNPISADRRIIYAQNDNVILKANFAMTYAVTAGKTEHGRIILTDAEGYTFDPGEKIKAQKIRITLAPDKGFMPDTLTVNGKGYAQTDMTAADDGSAYVEVALDKATAITAGFAAGTLGAEVIEAETQKGIYYDLNGRRLGAERPSRPGIYILMTGRKSQKIKIM